MPNPYFDDESEEIDEAVNADISIVMRSKSELRELMDEGEHPLSEDFISALLSLQEMVSLVKKYEKDLKDAKAQIKKYRNEDGPVQIGNVGVVTRSTREVMRLNVEKIKSELGTDDISHLKTPNQEIRIDVKTL